IWNRKPSRLGWNQYYSRCTTRQNEATTALVILLNRFGSNDLNVSHFVLVFLSPRHRNSTEDSYE
ncbi:hypothetical protein QUB47_34940, partial [Microcoleus sp. AT9_B5]